MNRIYSILTALALLAGFTMSAWAQGDDDPSQQTFRLVYIAHDNSMSVQALEKSLQDAYNHAMMEGPTVFYMANGSNPIIVRINMADDNRGDFENVLLSSLRSQPNHTIDGSGDKRRIIEMLNQHNFVTTEGDLRYGQTAFEFFVGKSFWTNYNNETLIGALFFELDIVNFIMGGRVSFNVYCPRTFMPDNAQEPFGPLNPDGINQIISLHKEL